MRIGIYHEALGPSAGGAEAVSAAIAETLAPQHAVTVITRHPTATLADWESAFAANLGSVDLRRLRPSATDPMWSRPWRRWQAQREQGQAATAGYDLVIGSIHTPPPLSVAPTGALYIHFPWLDRSTEYPYADGGRGVRRWARQRYAAWEWNRRFSRYPLVMANSEFTRRYIRDWWGLESVVVHPPVPAAPAILPKQPRILSVGRFADALNNKKQLELMRAFRQLPAESSGWEYVTVGGAEEVPRHQAYVERVRALAEGVPASVETNLSRARLEELYATASIFWHASGLGVAEDSPQHMEHFGIVTVEAMAAGCIPVVLARGGQPEIVAHGVTGFLWETEAELLQHTERLMGDAALRAAMSEAARQSARRFSPAAFRARLLTCLNPLLTTP